jgi:hypothetical protein
MADDISLIVSVDYSELTGLVKTAGQTKRALGSMAKEFANSGNQKAYMAGINKLVAAQKNLDKSARMSRSEIMKLGNQMQQEVKFTNALSQATVGLSQSQMAATKSSNRMGVVTQQAGYQVGDFLVQIQSGTNPMVAFGQQATQLVGVLPLMTGAFGLSTTALIGLSAGLGIAIPLATAIGAAFLRSSGGAKTLTQSVGELESATQSFTNFVETYTLDGLLNLEKKYKDVNGEVLRLVENQKFLSQAKLNKSLKDTVRLIGEITGARWYDIGISDYASSVLNLKETFKVTKGDAEVLLAAFQDVSKAEVGSLEQADALARVAGHMRTLLSTSDEVTDKQLELLNSVLDTEGAIRQMRGAAPEANWMSAAIKGVDSLYDKVTKAFNVAFKDAAKETKRAEEILLNLQNQASLQQKINDYGKDSTQVAAERLRIERETFQAMVDELQISEGFKKELMAAHDAAAALSTTDVGAGIRAAETSAENLARTLGIALSSAIALTTLTPMMSDEDIAMGQTAAPVSQGRVQDALKRYQGLIAPKSTGGGSSKKPPAEELREYLDKLQQQAKLERELVGFFGEKRTIEEAVIKARQKYDEVFGESQEAELRGTLALIAADKERQRVFEESEQQRQQLVSSIESTLEDGFMSMIDGTKSVKDAFRDMARDIIKELYRVLVVKKLVASISGFFGFADGGAFSGGSQIKAYADGGVVGGPTFFPMAGGKTGLMGEAGPEAIMPLKRGANGKLGVQAEGSSGGDVNIVQNFSFAANGDDSVKKLIAQAAPQIANMTQKQIMDSRRRGGSMKAAFG